MKGASFILAALTVIAIIADFRVEGLPSPQAGGSSKYKYVDGFAFPEDGDTENEIGFPMHNRPPSVQTTPTAILQPLGVTILPTTEAPNIVICIQNCPFQVTPEYNPVCGTDKIKYSNAGMLRCAKNCGRDVNLDHVGSCDTRIRGQG